jgi:polyisoprenoid-binding protein YceI
VKIVASLLVSSLLATAASAAPETYAIDTTHTYARFSYSHLGFSTQLSRFDKTSGTITYDAAAHTGSVDVVIDTTTVDSGYSTFNEHLRGADFLDTTTFPTATFKSTAVKFSGDKLVAVEGNLTIKGITKPVTLTVTSFQAARNPIMQKDEVGANATVSIKRTDFNAGKYVPAVSDDVELSIAVEAFKQ